MKKRLHFLCVLLLVLMFAEIVLMPVIGIIWGFGDIHYDRSSIHPSLAMAFSFLIVFICFIYFGISGLVDYVKFILNVGRDKIFVTDNVKLLRKCAWKFIVFMLSAVVVLLMVKAEPSDIYTCACSGIEVVFYFIIAEVFAVGIKLREEQELTI